jgi:hypothetical protein
MKTAKPEIRRRCKKCGHIYWYSFQIRGIPRCPECWGYEYKCVEYIDTRGRIIKDYQPYKEPEDFIPCFCYKDKGCVLATDFLGEQSYCTKNCPFFKCVDDKEITYTEREYLKQWRDIIRVYELADEGLKPIAISHKVGVSKYLVEEWLKRRDFLEAFIRQPVMAGGIK